MKLFLFMNTASIKAHGFRGMSVWVCQFSIFFLRFFVKTRRNSCFSVIMSIISLILITNSVGITIFFQLSPG